MKYYMYGKSILIFDSQGDLADTIKENIGDVSLSPPKAIDVAKTNGEVLKSIENNSEYSLFVINARDYSSESTIGRIYRNGMNSRIVDPEWDTNRILNEITSGLGCACSCTI